MRIPKYIRELMERAKFEIFNPYVNCVPGYTISIEKRTEYAQASTLKAEANRLVEWANREYRKMSGDNTCIANVDYLPTETHYRRQKAIVTITDPIMRYLEKEINQ